MLSVSEAAKELGLHPGRVRQLVVAGRLAGEKVGGRWLVAEDAVAARRAEQRPAGRPLSPRAAWGLLEVAAERPVPWLAPNERRRAEARAASWPLEQWVWACQRRAQRHGFYAHPSVIGAIADDRRLVRSGASVRSLPVDLVDPEHVEGYARAADLDALVADYALVESRRVNVVLHVPPPSLFALDGLSDAPWPVVAVDLFDAGDDRSVRAARRLFERHRP